MKEIISKYQKAYNEYSRGLITKPIIPKELINKPNIVWAIHEAAKNAQKR